VDMWIIGLDNELLSNINDLACG